MCVCVCVCVYMCSQANKECIQCLHYKPFTDFGKDRAQPDGYNRRCKACEKVRLCHIPLTCTQPPVHTHSSTALTRQTMPMLADPCVCVCVSKRGPKTCVRVCVCMQDTKVGSRRHTREHEDVTDSEDEDNTLLDPTHTHTHTTAGMPRVTRAAAAAAAGGAPLPLPTGLQPFPLPTQAAPTAFTAQAAGNALGLDPRLLFGVPQGTVGGNGNGVVGNGLRVEDWNYLMGAGGNGGGNTGAVGWGVVSTGNAGGGRDGTTVSRELPSFSAGFPALINTNGNAAGSQLLPPVAGLSTQPAGSQPQSQQQVPYNAFATRFESVFREGYDPELYEELVRQDVAIAGAGAGAPADPAVATLATTGLNGDSIVAMMPRSATLEQILNGHYNPSLPSPTGAPPAGAGAAGGSASLLRGMSRQLSVRMDSGAAANPERAASLRDVIDSTRQESLFGMQTGTAGRIDSLLGGAMRVDSNYNANTGPATRFDSLLGGAAKEFFANKAKEAAAAAATAANGVAPPATRAGDAAGAAGGSGAKSSSNSAGSPGLGLPQGSMALSAFGSLADPHALDGLVGRAGPDGVLGDPTRMVSLMSADGMDYALAQLKSRAPSDVSLVDAQSWLGPVPSQAAGPAGASAQQGAVKGSGDKASGEADA